MSKIVTESLTLFNYHLVLNGQHFRIEKPKINEEYKNSHWVSMKIRSIEYKTKI